MKAYLDNIPIAYPNETLTFPSITLRKQDETGDKAFSLTGSLIFTGTDYDYLFAQLKTSPTALINKVILKLVNDCCAAPQTYLFYIKAQSIKWCDDSCELEAGAVEYSQAEEQMTCLKNTLIWDDYAGFKSKQHPRFAYCNELRPNWMHDIMLILFVATATSILVIGPVIIIVFLIINTINGLLGWMNTNLSTSFGLIPINGTTNTDFNDLVNYYNLMVASIVGCGRKHPSPLVRDYADNVCGKCGITFSSSIFKNSASAYHNTCYHNAPVHKGTLETDTTTYWIDSNKPLRNGVQFFDELCSIVNGKWEIVGGVVYLERRDFFVPKTPFIDLTTYASDKKKVCYKWSAKTRYSYFNFEYGKDGVNWVGAEAKQRWDDIVEWNIPYSSLQKGELKPIHPFVSCRFRDDGIDRDVLTTYENFPTLGPIIKKYKETIIMNSHTCFQPMLLIWDGNSLDNAKVANGAYTFPGYPDAASNQFYNYPFWVQEGYPDNLYTNFWYIENPKITGYQGYDYTAEIQFDCALLTAIDLDGIVMTDEGVGDVKQININFKDNKMTITGRV